jgi:hypothetical protein
VKSENKGEKIDFLKTQPEEERKALRPLGATIKMLSSSSKQ